MDRRRAELSIYLQLARPEIVQDVPPERLLQRFPGILVDAGRQDEDKYDNLAAYDLIIAFDPDWTQLTPEQIGLLEQWVGQHAGGLIVVGRPVNTFQLAKAANYEKVKPILDLYPVILDDSRIQGLGVDRTASRAVAAELPRRHHGDGIPQAERRGQERRWRAGRSSSPASRKRRAART